jgi:hypothetical protein
VPASSSGKGEASIRNFFNFDLKMLEGLLWAKCSLTYEGYIMAKF